MPQFLRNYCFYVDVTIEIFYVCCIYQFYETYAANMQFISPLVRQISWTNNLLIISRCHSEKEREFYLRKSIDEHYSKRELDRQQLHNLAHLRCIIWRKKKFLHCAYTKMKYLQSLQ